ncbi:MAG TPA: hypothetical protein VG347_17885 [Verrucomicrobiae bacterium]|nr:hypothetical protein [Verrucomicrobiae bacterium]
MNPKKLVLIAAGLVAAGLIFFVWTKHPTKKTQTAKASLLQVSVEAVATNAPTNAPTIVQQHPKIKTRFSEFTSDERSEFETNFKQRYKPALNKWCEAYDGHLPFSPDSVSTDNFVERVGKNSSVYSEYVFVVDGVTLGIQDSKGVARVDYLNDPRQTQKMAALPKTGEAPIIAMPVNKDQLVKMLVSDGGEQFRANDVRLIPSAFSGALNGGALVHVGGDPDNAASWKYDLVFGADGKLAYYLKGNVRTQ